MSRFHTRLHAISPAQPTDRTWVYVPYDQLSDAMGPLARLEPADAGVVLIESRHKPSRRPYHRQKLALVLANQRHFALEQAARGVAVRYEISDAPYAAVLRDVARDTGPLTMQRAAERELRDELAGVIDEGLVSVVPHEGWLTTPADFAQLGGAPWRMDAFYRGVRQRTGWLMDDRGKPLGGRYSHDGDNRKPWRGDPVAPAVPVFTPDPITREVAGLVERHFSDHPGTLRVDQLPTTAADAEALWAWAMSSCLPNFGPYEDAMSREAASLFHTRVSPLLNLHRLLPERVVRDAMAADLPLSSAEGFLRQVLGWREFVRHVHEATDGFRDLPTGPAPLDETGHAMPSALGADRPLPEAFWGAPSGLACLDHVVAQVWDEGWSHHITRLMVLSNLATLLDVSPRALTDWFWVAYIDAYDWVVEPNVLGMGTFGVGELFTTKPYVSGAAYLNRMSDYCGSCAFHPKKTCPITGLYWDFLRRHRDVLAGNRRVAMPLRSLAKRSDAQQASDAETFAWVRDTLARGDVLAP